MKHISRLGWTILAAGTVAFAVNNQPCFAQSVTVLPEAQAYLIHTSQGYLGVGLRDIDSDRAATLKLKDVRGAEVVTVDHDAPANKAGLKPEDVILEMNGQRVEGAEQLRRMLRETPAGHTVHFVISRDGQQQNISVELADRAKIEANAWSQHFTIPDPGEPPMGEGFVAPSAPPRGFGNSFFGVFSTNSMYVGADVDAISTQLANYFGVTDGTGLLVRSVDENSPAATAGLKAGDVITKVNADRLASRADWLKALHNNRGKQVQLTVMRNKKEQTLSMQAGEPKKKGELDFQDFCPPVQVQAEVDGDFAMLDSNQLQREIDAAVHGVNTAALAQANAIVKDIDTQKLSKELQKKLGAIDQKKLQKQMGDLGHSLDQLELQDLQ